MIRAAQKHEKNQPSLLCRWDMLEDAMQLGATARFRNHVRLRTRSVKTVGGGGSAPLNNSRMWLMTSCAVDSFEQPNVLLVPSDTIRCAICLAFEFPSTIGFTKAHRTTLLHDEPSGEES